MTDSMTEYTFAEFLQHEIEQRDMTIREFARLLDVSHSTVLRFLEFGKKDVGYPSVEFIAKVAAATDTKVSTIMALLLPDLPQAADEPEDPEIIALARRFRELPKNDFKLIASYIRNAKGAVKPRTMAEIFSDGDEDESEA